jgi:hypothetical protein
MMHGQQNIQLLEDVTLINSEQKSKLRISTLSTFLRCLLFLNKITLFTSKLDLNLKKKPAKCYIWSTAMCDAEIWTLRKLDQKYQERFET